KFTISISSPSATTVESYAARFTTSWLRSTATRRASMSSCASSALTLSGSARSCGSPFSLMVIGLASSPYATGPLQEVYSHTDLGGEAAGQRGAVAGDVRRERPAGPPGRDAGRG